VICSEKSLFEFYSSDIFQSEIDVVCETIDFLKFNASFASRIYELQPQLAYIQLNNEQNGGPSVGRFCVYMLTYRCCFCKRADQGLRVPTTKLVANLTSFAG